MAKKEEQKPIQEVSGIVTIRNILMGQQMAEYEAEFAKVRQQMEADRTELSGKLSEFSARTDERFAKLEKEVGERFDRLEKLLDDNVARLDAKFLEMAKADKQDLGQMLAEIGKKLAG